jgi:Ni/Fe-hydrogenase 1 B-type cytochrome subunit
MSEEIQRVAVWPPLLRLLHIVMAGTMLILLITGILLHSGMILNYQLFEHLLHVWHIPAGHVLAIALAIRIVMLFVTRGVSSWKALIPENMQSVVGVAVFYLSLARNNLPGYFAHNPLWKVFYLLGFIMITIQVLTGLLLEFSWLRSVFKTDSATALVQHQMLLEVLLVFVVAHIITAILHDWKTNTGEISAMINGYKFFTVEKQSKQTVQTSAVSLDSLIKSKK